MRYKVGEVVTWNGYQWANTSGVNEEPSTSKDWERITNHLIIDGYDVKKGPGKQNIGAIEVTDRCEYYDTATDTDYGFKVTGLPVSDESNRSYYKSNSI